MSSRGIASDRQLPLPLGHAVHGDETGTGTRGVDAPVEGQDLLARVLDPDYDLERELAQYLEEHKDELLQYAMDTELFAAVTRQVPAS